MSGLWMVLDYQQPGLSPPDTRGSRRWLPQRAWLDGTVLVVERGDAARQCDLAAASAVTLRARRFDGFLVLRAGDRRHPPRDWSLRASPHGWRWASGPDEPEPEVEGAD